MEAITQPLAADGGELAAGTRIGRFVVHHTIGAGGMGVVVAALDPVLDRWVALKLLRATPGRADAALIAEAQAMARLAHPNVVAVHDAGTADGRVYLAMELVAGGTLRAWLDAAPRSWRDILDRYVAAGRGLAAAHDAGLVHRDFKPENVLVGNDGRPRVTDFGLVHETPAADANGSRDASPRATLRAPAEPGLSIAGTLRYMAPEQHASQRADARADQFAFCVALYEALWDRDPFAAPDPAARTARALAGEHDPPPASDVPAEVAAAVVRGLAADPARRHPTMHALLDELGLERAAARRRWWRFAAVGLAGAALATLVGALILPRHDGVECEAAADDLAPIWPERRSHVDAALSQLPRSYAAVTAQHATATLDAWATSWRAARVDACRATNERGTQSAALLDARMRCLDHRLAAFRALVDVLAVADVTTLDRAVAAAEGLPAAASCDDATALAEQTPPPADPIARAATIEIGQAVARADALIASGRYREGVALMERAHEHAVKLADPPTLAMASIALAGAAIVTGQPRSAEPALHEAIRAAAAARDDMLVARGWLELAFVWATRLGRAREARGLRDTVETALARAGGGEVLQGRWSQVLANIELELGHPAEARIAAAAAVSAWERRGSTLELARSLDTLGAALRGLGKLDEAAAAHRRSLAIREATLGAGHPECAASLVNLGNVLLDAHDSAGATAAFRRTLELVRAAAGDSHPDLASAWVGLAALDTRARRFDDAAAQLERALALRLRLFGTDSPEVALVRNDLGNLRFDQGRFDEAEQLYRAARDGLVASYGPDHPRVAIALNNLGEVARSRGHPAEALDFYRGAIAIRERMLGPDHPGLAVPLTNVGEVALALGRLDDAEAADRRALALFEASRGKDHPLVAYPLIGLGEVALARGRRSDAVAPLERALALATRGNDPEAIARATRALARARGSTVRD